MPEAEPSARGSDRMRLSAGDEPMIKTAVKSAHPFVDGTTVVTFEYESESTYHPKQNTDSLQSTAGSKSPNSPKELRTNPLQCYVNLHPKKSAAEPAS
jgi:hypothetical protein